MVECPECDSDEDVVDETGEGDYFCDYCGYAFTDEDVEAAQADYDDEGYDYCGGGR